MSVSEKIQCQLSHCTSQDFCYKSIKQFVSMAMLAISLSRISDTFDWLIFVLWTSQAYIFQFFSWLASWSTPKRQTFVKVCPCCDVHRCSRDRSFELQRLMQQSKPFRSQDDSDRGWHRVLFLFTAKSRSTTSLFTRYHAYKSWTN